MGLVQRTVYFREEDILIWDAIANKAAWLHTHLNEPVLNTYVRHEVQGTPHKVQLTKPDPPQPTKPRNPPKDYSATIPNKSKFEKIIDNPCPDHDWQEKGRCMIPGCKYGKRM